MKVFTVVGNRPQFIKAAPLSAALGEILGRAEPAKAAPAAGR